MKLIEYLNNPIDFKEDYIHLLKMESFFKEQSSKPTILYTSLGRNSTLDKIPNNINTILSSNPDCDFPPPKNDIFIYQDSPMNVNLQKQLDNMEYENKINKDILVSIPSHIKRIYCHSVGYSHNKVTMIPIGRDFKNLNILHITNKFSLNNKSQLCYYNCTLPLNIIHWYGMLRKHIFDICKKKPFIKTEYCQIQRKYTTIIKLNYFKNLAYSKFMICPRGCGIDSYRIWDCIHMGCIPIVEKYQGYQQFTDLPILFIDHWKCIENLTEDYLNNKWIEMLNTNYNYEKLRFSYWYHLIINS